MNNEKCSCCHRPLTTSYTFSPPVEGLPQTFACNRWWCQWFRQGKKLGVFLAWYDFWIGIYFDRQIRKLYICPFPMIVVWIQLAPEDKAKTASKAFDKTVRKLLRTHTASYYYSKEVLDKALKEKFGWDFPTSSPPPR